MYRESITFITTRWLFISNSWVFLFFATHNTWFMGQEEGSTRRNVFWWCCLFTENIYATAHRWWQFSLGYAPIKYDTTIWTSGIAKIFPNSHPKPRIYSNGGKRSGEHLIIPTVYVSMYWMEGGWCYYGWKKFILEFISYIFAKGR